MTTSPRPCSYCAHTYANPCDGKDATCGNKLHLDSKDIPMPIWKDLEQPAPEPKRERIRLDKKPKATKRERIR